MVLRAHEEAGKLEALRDLEGDRSRRRANHCRHSALLQRGQDDRAGGRGFQALSALRRHPYFDSSFWAAEEMPSPTVRNDPPIVKFWLGDEDVMNR
jgi:hypothetical protein